MNRNYYRRADRRNFSSDKDVSQDNYINRLINQSVISVLFLLGVIILHFSAPNSNIAKNLKYELNRNLPIENVKKFVVQNFNTAKEILLNDPKDNQKLIKQMQKTKTKKVKKNPSPSTSQNPKT